MKICVGSIHKAVNVHDQDHSKSSDVQHYTFLHLKGYGNLKKKQKQTNTILYQQCAVNICITKDNGLVNCLTKNIPMYLTALGTVNYASTLSQK